MPKQELGLKRICMSCGARFYDLARQPAVCPKCGTQQPVEQPRPRRGGNVAEVRKPKKIEASEEPETDQETEPDAEEGEDGVLEDTSDLDDDAIGSELEVEPDNDEAER